jgi:hypothetical protein
METSNKISVIKRSSVEVEENNTNKANEES